METFFLIVWWGGMISVGCLYWFKHSSPNDSFVIRRYKTTFATVGWPIYLIRMYLAKQGRQADQAEAEAVKKRILGGE